MRRWSLVALLMLAPTLGVGGCRGGAAEQPMAGDLELCCKAAVDEVSFVGCRPTGHCRTSESVWIRGPLTCTADEPEQCAGGRCCALDLATVAALGPIPPIGPGSTSTTTPTRAPVDSLEPARITPVPLDWSPLPTAISVPRLLCPATAERGVTGVVVMQVEVDADGRVTAVAIRSGFEPECDALARDALLHAEFEPALNPEGQPIASSLRYEYEFALTEHPPGETADEAP